MNALPLPRKWWLAALPLLLALAGLAALGTLPAQPGEPPDLASTLPQDLTLGVVVCPHSAILRWTPGQYVKLWRDVAMCSFGDLGAVWMHAVGPDGKRTVLCLDSDHAFC